MLFVLQNGPRNSSIIQFVLQCVLCNGEGGSVIQSVIRNDACNGRERLKRGV